MAQPNLQLIQALRETANKLKNGSHYAWGHHGACNCGNLVQVITKFTEGEILAYAHEGIGEWTELAQEFCPITNAPISLVIAKLQEAGLTPTDIHHVEYLNDKNVLMHLEGGFRWLQRNKKEDAIAYFEAFANMLEEKLLQTIEIDFSKISNHQQKEQVEFA
jgi:hypothetical protein